MTLRELKQQWERAACVELRDDIAAGIAQAQAEGLIPPDASHLTSEPAGPTHAEIEESSVSERPTPKEQATLAPAAAVATKPKLESKRPGKGRPPSLLVANRRNVILHIAQRGFTGLDYAKQMDFAGLKTPREWQRRGCPERHQDAFAILQWRQCMQNEKSKATSQKSTRQKSR